VIGVAYLASTQLGGEHGSAEEGVDAYVRSQVRLTSQGGARVICHQAEGGDGERSVGHSQRFRFVADHARFTPEVGRRHVLNHERLRTLLCPVLERQVCLHGVFEVLFVHCRVGGTELSYDYTTYWS